MFLFLIPYVLSDTCEPAQNNCVSCKSTNLKYCEVCEDGYTAYRGKCKSCLDNCKKCKSVLSPTVRDCSECFDGYYVLPYNGNYGTCTKCPQNCKKCQNADTCTECEDHYYTDNNQCKPCHESCLTCTGPSETECKSCNDGFYIDPTTNLCRPCGSNCKKCDKPTECIQCDDGYYTNDSNQCIKCHESCKTCNGVNKEDCIECARGYFKESGSNLCSKCNEICGECETTADNCISCNDGYYINGNTCSKCNTNCHTCNSADICTSCDPGFYLINNNCNDKCTASLHCYECEYAGAVQCTSCLPGYYLNMNKACKSCEVEGCSKCNQIYQCDACMSGYLKEGNVCKKCDQTCRECEGTTSTCTFCFDGYYKDGTTCKKCTDNCYQCNSESDCTKCVDGYYNLNGKCQKCDQSCSTCNDGTNACINCAIGYYKNDLLRCVKCGDNCDECTSDTHCTKCASEFYKTESFTCLPCAEVCFECTGPTDNDCIECDPGFYFSNTLKKCFKCDKACTVCDGPNDYNCSECALGYYMNKDEYINLYEIVDKCVECEYGCLYCNSSQNCLKCKDGYYLSNGDCFHCDEGCGECTAAQKCTKCLDGYYVAERNGNFVVCDSCPSNCKSCQFNQNEEFICNSCFDGYLLKNNNCIKCSHPCATCSSSENKCDSCIDGYLLDKPKSSCNSKCESSCQSCETDPSKCVTCHDGFVLNGNICLGCPSGCKTCEFEDGTSICTGCLEGFYKLQEQCYPCDTSCATCYGSYNNQCYSCREGYAMSFRDLEPYITATCSKCDDSRAGIPNCELCTSKCSETEESANCPITCTKCTDGYYLSNNVCFLCHESCGTCGTSAIDCLTCADDYYFHNGACEKCDASCLGCSDDPTVCTSCRSHKYLLNGKCEECDSSCSECQGSPTYCTSCPGNKYSYEGRCYESCGELGDDFGYNSDRECTRCKLSNCKVFDSSCRCTECKQGFFYLYDPVTSVQLCKACFTENCKTCSADGKTCQKCQDGFQTGDNKCTPYPIEPDDSHRYVQKEENAEQKHFIIEKTTVTGTSVAENGGAILMINQGLTCIDTTFKNCVSSNGGGGGIFIYNKNPERTNKIEFKNLVIQSCEASFGGGAFIYSISDESPIVIESCKFIGNKVSKEGKNNFVGGSALYLVVKDGQVNECLFSKNKGGNIIKTSRNFDAHPDANSVMMLQKEEVYSSFVLITKCTFEIYENSTSSLIYYVEKQTSRFDVNDFVFANFDGKSKAAKLNSVLFSNSQRRELNKKFIAFDSDNQDSERKDKALFSSNATASICVLIVAGVALVAATIILKRNKNTNQESNERLELSSRSIDQIEE